MRGGGEGEGGLDRRQKAVVVSGQCAWGVKSGRGKGSSSIYYCTGVAHRRELFVGRNSRR